MLSRLKIKGFAIVDQLTVQFTPGFNVITGETGSGKSILIKALDLLRGERAGSDVIKPGYDRLEIEAEFCEEPGAKALNYLEELGIAYDSKKRQIVLQRSIDLKGKSQFWVGESPLSLAKAKALGGFLLDIFAQHSSHLLLEEKNHSWFLDQFLPDKSAYYDYLKIWQELSGEHATLEAIAKSYQEKSGRDDYLRFRLQQIEELDPSAQEYEKLREFCKQSEQDSVFKKNLKGLEDILTEGGESGDSLVSRVSTFSKACERLKNKHPELGGLSDLAKQLSGLASDVSYELAKHVAEKSFDMEEFEAAQGRLARYQEMVRKFSLPGVLELEQLKEHIADELKFLDEAKAKAQKLVIKLERLTKDARLKAQALSRLRQENANRLAASIHSHLEDLGMPRARLEVSFQPRSLAERVSDFNVFGADFQEGFAQSLTTIKDFFATHNEGGAERAVIMVSTNPEAPLSSIAKIASGGEASRLLLACHNALASDQRETTLVFDEIDNGISGKIAAKVGRKIKEASKSGQIICISHLAQVAAFADHHIGIAKKQGATETKVSCAYFDEKGRVKEIAKLLSGEKVTAVSLKNAENLLLSSS